MSADVISLVILAGLCLIIWCGLTFGWHRFWKADQKLPVTSTSLTALPSVVAVVPARNEEETIERCLKSILAQDYPGNLRVVLSNDSSTDATDDIARAIGDDRLNVITAPPLEAGWAGKMWALSHGVAAAQAFEPEFYWFTDADIHHESGVLSSLVSHAQNNGLALVSLMVRLHVKTFWEKLLVPAFIYYFCLLYPFPAINNPNSKIAGAAGGCILIDRTALEKAGGIAAVRNAIIDDCAIGKIIKDTGNTIWLGLGEHSYSLRGYPCLADFWLMVKRSAFVQLRRSLILTIGALAGLCLTFLAPPALVGVALIHGPVLAGICALAAWALMTFSYAPTIRYHRLRPSWALSLPIAALLFGAMTLDSALSGAFGRRTSWRGRDIESAQD